MNIPPPINLPPLREPPLLFLKEMVFSCVRQDDGAWPPIVAELTAAHAADTITSVPFAGGMIRCRVVSRSIEEEHGAATFHLIGEVR